jgi:hypothetical protein
MAITAHGLGMSALFGLAHYLDLGAKLALHVVGETALPPLPIVANLTATCTLWLFIAKIVPWAAKLILLIYEIGERVSNACGVWTTQKVIYALRWALDRLNGAVP